MKAQSRSFSILSLILILNAFASSPADAAAVTAPGGFGGQVVSSSEIDLSWQASTASGDKISSYRVFRKGSVVATVPASQLSYKDTGLRVSTKYSYNVRGVNSRNQVSPASALISATTLFAPVKYSVRPSGRNVSFSPSGAQSVNAGAQQAFSVTANSGYQLSSSAGGTCPVGSWAGSVYTTGAITANCTVSFSAAGTAITIGDKKIETGLDNGKANLIAAQQATLAKGATVVSLSFYVTSAAGNLTLGIYDASGPKGGPGALKATTASFAPAAGLEYGPRYRTRSACGRELLAGVPR